MKRNPMLVWLAALALAGTLAFPAAASADGGRDWGHRGHGHDSCRSKHCNYGKKHHHRRIRADHHAPRYREPSVRPTVAYRDPPPIRGHRDNDITIIYRGGWD